MTANLAAFSYNDALEMAANGHLSRAEELMTQAIVLDGENQLYYDALGLCRFALGRFAAAKASWSIGTSMGQENGKAAEYLRSMDTAPFYEYVRRYNFCIESIAKGRFLRALAIFLPALKALPNAEGNNLAGLLFHRLGMRKNARTLWRRTIELDATNEEALRYLAHARAGWLPAALERILWGVLSLAGWRKLL